MSTNDITGARLVSRVNDKNYEDGYADFKESVMLRTLHEEAGLTQKYYVDFNPSDFIKNRIALARMQAKITQASLAKYLKVSQAYISKIENDGYKVTDRLFEKVSRAIKRIKPACV